MTLEEELIWALYITGSITYDEADIPEMAEDAPIVEMVEIDTGFDEKDEMVDFLDGVIMYRLGIREPSQRLTIQCEDNVCRVYA